MSFSYPFIIFPHLYVKLFKNNCGDLCLMKWRTKSNRIVVVGIIGKSRGGKAHILNEIIDIPVFKVYNPFN